jgi:hypothetical protein
MGVKTVIELLSFTATSTHTFTPTSTSIYIFFYAPTRKILTWTTASELDNAGFNLWRSDSENGRYIRITDLIPGRRTT